MQQLPFAQKLVLFRYLLAQFGYEDSPKGFDVLRGNFSDRVLSADVVDASIFYTFLQGKTKFSDAKLKQYDDNIIAHLQQINRKRSVKISLKYYQYLFYHPIQL